MRPAPLTPLNTLTCGPPPGPAPDELLSRLRARDPSLWPEGNVSPTRLGWVDVPARMREEAADLAAWAATVDARRVVLLGMGGSSLGPEVLRSAVGSDRLVVLDTTEPETVASTDLDDAFFLVSSKSGTTLEALCLLAYCWDRVPDGRRYAAITDPGTPLAELARDYGFARVFLNPPDIGGRYSVLSYFGLVPAALCGIDVVALCDAALATELNAFQLLTGSAVVANGTNLVSVPDIGITLPAGIGTTSISLKVIEAQKTYIGPVGGSVATNQVELTVTPVLCLLLLDRETLLDRARRIHRHRECERMAGLHGRRRRVRRSGGGGNPRGIVIPRPCPAGAAPRSKPAGYREPARPVTPSPIRSPARGARTPP